MLHTLREPANEGRVWIVDGGLLEFKLLRNGQITIHSILSTKHGVGSQLLNRLLDYAREHGATSLFAKCPTDLESNAWYEKKGFKIEKVEDTGSKSGRKLNCWRLPLIEQMPVVRDGFFYHPGGSGPDAQLKRLVDGEHNVGFDNLFATTIDEADAAIRQAEEEYKKTEERLHTLKAKIVDLNAHKEQVKEAVRHFEDTGEITDVLIPECRKLIADERKVYADEDKALEAEEIETATAALKGQIGDDWDIADSHADDEFVYVTIKRPRQAAAPARPSAEEIALRVIEKVRQAFDTYRFEFKNRVRVLDFMATPARPGAP